MPTLTGWEAVVLAMKAEGVPYVFGLPGDPRHLYDALVAIEPDGGPRPIGVRFETSGAFMAMAYARVTNQIAACFGCPGPGIANLVPGILEAYSGCTPMLVLGVRSPRQTYGKGSFQETDHVAMLSSITKWATTVELPENIPWVMRHQRPARAGLRRASRRHRAGRLGDPGLYAGGAGFAPGRRSRRIGGRR
ncbi:MAG: thiamine pyrophosphate protein central region [Thermomicrobiales bacterium]|nr:thiamine pyrophosphate protein central region [Thermomicrobiales bacterium]